MEYSRKDGRVGTNAVKNLRIQKLRRGHPFMIYSKTLPSRYCYLEFPEGKIVLATYSSESRDFIEVRQLSMIEASDIRQKYGLQLIA